MDFSLGEEIGRDFLGAKLSGYPEMSLRTGQEVGSIDMLPSDGLGADVGGRTGTMVLMMMMVMMLMMMG